MPAIETLILLLAAAFIGACFGSLINVVIYRLPIMLEREWLGECLGYLREYLYAKKIPTSPETPPPINSPTSPDHAAEVQTPIATVNEVVLASPPLISPTFPYLADPKAQRLSELISLVEADQNIDEHAAPFNLSVPRSHCPACQAMIPWYRNIPLFTWLSQWGRAHCCGVKISSRYFWVEVAGAVLTFMAMAHFGFTIQGVAASVLLLMLLTLAGIDWETRLLPDQFTLSLMWLGLLVNVHPYFVPLPDAVIGAVAGYGVLWSIFQVHRLITQREGMGFGDFKLTAAFGAWFGYKALPIILVIAAVVGIVGALSTMRVRDNPRAEPIPFGPALCLAAAVYLFYGAALTKWLIL